MARIAYTEELAERVCEQIALGVSVRGVAKQEGMPKATTVWQWLAKHDAFAQQYARAKERAMDVMAEEIMEIADDEENDWQRARLRVDTRKWVMSKLAAKKYGDKQTLDHQGGVRVIAINGDESKL